MDEHNARHPNHDRWRDAFLTKQSDARSLFSWTWMLILAGLAFLAVLLYVSAPL